MTTATTYGDAALLSHQVKHDSLRQRKWCAVFDLNPAVGGGRGWLFLLLCKAVVWT
jgi:hypothetical protein